MLSSMRWAACRSRQGYDGRWAALPRARRIVGQAAHILTGLGGDAFTVIGLHQPSPGGQLV
jgi:hypothetical protein